MGKQKKRRAWTKNRVGEQVRSWVVKERHPNDAGNGKARWICECVGCKKERIVRNDCLHIGGVPRCQCQQTEVVKPPSLIKSIEWLGVDDFTPTKDPEPTKSAIGSRERIEEYRRRIERGQQLYHDEDNPEADKTTRVIFNGRRR